MTAAPMLTTAFWWFSLALMMRPFECNGGLESGSRALNKATPANF
jgi:hypothetical protein